MQDFSKGVEPFNLLDVVLLLIQVVCKARVRSWIPRSNARQVVAMAGTVAATRDLDHEKSTSNLEIVVAYL